MFPRRLVIRAPSLSTEPESNEKIIGAPAAIDRYVRPRLELEGRGEGGEAQATLFENVYGVKKKSATTFLLPSIYVLKHSACGAFGGASVTPTHSFALHFSCSSNGNIYLFSRILASPQVSF